MKKIFRFLFSLFYILHPFFKTAADVTDQHRYRVSFEIADVAPPEEKKKQT
jgi:hypothetical protein